MRKLTLTAVFAASTFFGFSQTDDPLADYSMELQWGPVVEIEDSDLNTLIAATSDAYYIKSLVGQGYFSKGNMMFSKFDINTHEVQWSVEYDDLPEYLNEETVFMDSYYSNGAIHLFFTSYHSRNDERFLLHQEIRDDGTVTDLERVSTLSTDDDDEGAIYPRYYGRLKQYLFTTYPQQEDEDENRLMHFELLDSAFITKWSREIEFPFSYENTRIINVSISNQGELFVLLRRTRDRDRDEPKIDDNPNTRYYLYRINTETDEVSEFDLGLENVWVSNINMETNYSSELLIIAGTYSNEEFDQVAGTFFITLDKATSEVKTGEFQEFGNRTLLNYMDQDDIADGDEIELPFVFRDAIPREDGGAVLVFEHYAKVLHQVTNSRGQVVSTYYTWTYGSMILQNINPDGTVGWTEVVDKMWYERFNLGGGYFDIVHQDRLHIVYNDHEDNIEYWSGEEDRLRSADLDDGNIVMVTIDLEGNMVYEVIDRSEDDDDLKFAPTSSQYIRGTEGRETLWFRYDDEEFRVGRFQFIDDNPVGEDQGMNATEEN